MAILNRLGLATPYRSGRKRISWSVTEMFVEQSLASPKSAKNIWGKLQKSEPDLKLWTLRPRGLHFIEWLDTTKINHPRNSGRGRGRGLTSNFFSSSIFSENSWSCPEAYRGGGPRRKSLLDGVTDLLAKIWQRDSVSLHVGFYQKAQKHL